MIKFLTSLAYRFYKALERNGESRAKRYINLHRGSWS